LDAPLGSGAPAALVYETIVGDVYFAYVTPVGKRWFQSGPAGSEL
jgi:hypothetical protein